MTNAPVAMFCSPTLLMSVAMLKAAKPSPATSTRMNAIAPATWGLPSMWGRGDGVLTRPSLSVKSDMLTSVLESAYAGLSDRALNVVWS